MAPRRRVVVMIPTLNEEVSIGRVLDGVPYIELNNMGLDVEVIVVDGHSRDKTQEIANIRKAKIFTQDGKGKGLAVRQAFDLSKPEEVVNRVLNLTTSIDSELRTLSTFLDSQYVIMLDGDGTYPSHHILDLVASLEQGYDAVMGSRFMGEIEAGAMTRLNRIGNYVLSAMATGLYFQRVTDLCTGMWGFRTSVLKDLVLSARNFDLEAELFAECAKNHLRIKEVPITYKCREGETKLVPISAGLIIGLKLLERRVDLTNFIRGHSLEDDMELPNWASSLR
jgi:glycosyltransferase involved in cell wall biosynthesis